MRGRIEAWITKLLHSAVASEFAALRARADKDVAMLGDRLENLDKRLASTHRENAAEMTLLKGHISSEVERPLDTIKQHVAAEITSRYDLVMEKAATAARESLADMRRVSRMPCDICKHLSWKFKIDSDGRVICADCEVKLGHSK